MTGEIDGHFFPRRRDDVAATTLGRETVIHDRARLFHLDPVATVVWECCDGTVTIDALASELGTTFRVDVETARRDVLGAIRALAADGLLAAVDGSADGLTSEVPPSHDDDVDPELEVRFAVGGLLLGVSTDHAGARDALRTILAAHVTDAGGAPAASYAIAFAEAAPPGAHQQLHTVYDQDGPLLQTLDPSRALARALDISAHGDLAATGLGALPTHVIGHTDTAVLVARGPELPLDTEALGRHGLAVADGIVAFVDCAGSVVVGAPGLDADLDALDRFAATLPAAPDPVAPLPWGRIRVAALATDQADDASHALLLLGPIADDDTPAVSGADLALDALLGLLATVPIVAAPTPSAIAAALREPSR